MTVADASPLAAARAAAAAVPDPAPGTWAAHLHAALAEADRLQDIVSTYGSPILGGVPLPEVNPVWERRAAVRALMESGVAPSAGSVGFVICPNSHCPAGPLAMFKPLKGNRVPMHRSSYGTACSCARAKAIPLVLATIPPAA